MRLFQTVGTVFQDDVQRLAVRFSRKVLLMPALAGLSFLGVLLINEVTGGANAKLIGAIQREYLPALELSRGVRNALFEIQRSLQDAVTAAEPDDVAKADAHGEQLLALLRDGRTNPAFRPGEIAALEAAFADYYADARDTTVRMMNRESGETLEPALERMSARYVILRDRLEASKERQSAEVEAALNQALANHRRSIRMVTGALVLGLLSVAIMSRTVIRSTLASLRGAAAASAALAGQSVPAEASDDAVAGDEIDQILASMQAMMRALADSERRLKEAQRLAHVGSWEWQMPSSRTTWSEEMHHVFGIEQAPPSDLQGFLASVHPDDRDQVKAALLAGVDAGAPFEHQFRIVRTDGEIRTILTRNEVVLDEDQALVGLRGAVQDVTDIERIASALRASEERYRMLFENNPHPMWVYDVDSLRFLAVNAAAVAHYGYSRDEFLGMTIFDIRPAEDVEPLRARVTAARAGPEKAGVWRHRRKDGSLVEVEISSHPVAFGAQSARLVLASDVTERGRLERQLRQAQKMEAVGRLAGGVAHDFNNILGVIMGYGEIVARRLPSGDALAGKVAEILRAAERAAGLTRQLLAFSRQQVLQPRMLELNGVVEEMDKMLRRLIGEDVELKTRLEERLGLVMADPGQMEQVIMNLAVNARDAMPEGGSLLLETCDVELDDSYVRLHPGARAGPHVMLAVSDTGSGMDPATLARLFEPFFTTKPAGKGTGLGLSTVYGIVDQSGGSIDVYSEPGHGTTFKIYLPRVAGQAAPVAVPAPAPAPAGSETVLLVEDEEALREMIRELLEDAGYRVLEAATPREALAIAGTHQGGIHMLLTDVIMPGMSGRELAERLEPLRPGVAVVYMSGYTDDAIGQHGLLDAGTHFLQKPFTTPQLLIMCREALSSGSPVTRAARAARG